MTRTIRMLVVTALTVCVLSGCAAKGGMRIGEENASILFLSPMDEQVITPADDLNDDDTDHIQFTVEVETLLMESGEELTLFIHHETWGGDWEHTAAIDASGRATFSPVTFWEGTGEDPSVYSLTVHGREGAVVSETIRVDIALPLGLDPADMEAPPDWQIDCISCTTDADCDNGLSCPGREECGWGSYAEAYCCYTVELDCTSDDVCMMGTCSEEFGGCIEIPLDLDGDGHSAEFAPDDTTMCGGTDCDDTSYAIHPGARESCDGVDNDCDRAIDEDAWVATGAPIDLSAPGAEPSSPSLAPGATSWGVAWIAETSTGRELHAGAILPGTGLPTANTGIIEMGSMVPLDAVIVPTGTGFAVLAVVPHGEGTAIIGYPVSADGTLTSSEHGVLAFWTTILDIDAAYNPGADRIGVSFRVNEEGDYELFFMGFSWPPPTMGTWTDTVMMTRALGFSGWPSIVSTDTGFAVAWEDDRDGNMEIYFQKLTALGDADGPARRITSAPGHSQNVSLAWSAEGFALAWMDSRAGGYDLLFTCLDPAGDRVCPEVGIAAGPDVAWYPSLTYQGFAGQFALAYAGREGSDFTVNTTAVPITPTVMPTSIDVGTALTEGSASVSFTSIEDAGEDRGVLWVEGERGGGNTLRFEKLVCKP